MKNYIITKTMLIALFAIVFTPVFSQTQEMNKMWGEAKVSVDALKAGRGKLFDEGNFGMFIHWGLFSHLGGKWQGKTYY